jgi:hypothetical protein
LHLLKASVVEQVVESLLAMPQTDLPSQQLYHSLKRIQDQHLLADSMQLGLSQGVLPLSSLSWMLLMLPVILQLHKQ